MYWFSWHGLVPFVWQGLLCGLGLFVVVLRPSNTWAHIRMDTDLCDIAHSGKPYCPAPLEDQVAGIMMGSPPQSCYPDTGLTCRIKSAILYSVCIHISIVFAFWIDSLLFWYGVSIKALVFVLVMQSRSRYTRILLKSIQNTNVNVNTILTWMQTQ